MQLLQAIIRYSHFSITIAYELLFFGNSIQLIYSNFVQIFQLTQTMTKLFTILLVLAASFSKAEYFKIMEGKDVSTINAMLTKINASKESGEQRAYKGALMMKKSSFEKTPKDKIELFKQGKTLLEKEIGANSKNTEYRFLRLIIQENTPAILKYQSNIAEDAQWIEANYSSLDSDVKSSIVSYAKASKNLDL